MAEMTFDQISFIYESIRNEYDRAFTKYVLSRIANDHDFIQEQEQEFLDTLFTYKLSNHPLIQGDYVRVVNNYDEKER